MTGPEPDRAAAGLGARLKSWFAPRPAAPDSPGKPVDLRPLILCIGLNKCGTTSLHHLFASSGISSVHWRDISGRLLAPALVSNLSLGLPPLRGFESYRAISDMIHLDDDIVVEGARFYRELHAAYPDACFILNTRDPDNWLCSRLQHGNPPGSFAADYARAAGVPIDRIGDLWREMFIRHTQKARAYLAPRARFLEFDIETDDPRRIRDFLAPDYHIDVAAWSHRNPSSNPERVPLPADPD